MFDSYVAHHYTNMEKVILDFEPTNLKDAIEDTCWDKVIKEELHALIVNKT